MLGQPPGWYRDPAPRDRGAPDTLRWWDGMSWTARTRAGSKRERRQWREEAAAERLVLANDLLERAEAGDEDALWQLEAASRATTTAAATVDGQRLGGWWARFGAALVDSTLMTVLGTLLAWRFLQQLVTATGRYVEAATAAAP